jgi:hypothetical protein
MLFICADFLFRKLYINLFLKYEQMFCHRSSSKGKHKQDESLSSHSFEQAWSDSPASLFVVTISFYFHLYVLVSIYMF